MEKYIIIIVLGIILFILIILNNTAVVSSSTSITTTSITTSSGASCTKTKYGCCPDGVNSKVNFDGNNCPINKQQNIAKDELIFWQRLFQPANTLLMMLLAIPCIFGPLRSSTMGAKLVAGIALGFGFYILNQMFGFVSQVYQIPPIMGATIPMLIFGSLGIVLMSRTR